MYLIIIGIFIKLLTFSCPYDNENDCINLFVLPHLNQWAVMIMVPTILIIIIFVKTVKRQVNILLVFAYIMQLYYIFFYRDTSITLLNYNGAVNLILVIYILLIAISSLFYFSCKYIFSIKKIRVYLMIFILVFTIRQIYLI